MNYMDTINYDIDLINEYSISSIPEEQLLTEFEALDYIVSSFNWLDYDYIDVQASWVPHISNHSCVLHYKNNTFNFVEKDIWSDTKFTLPAKIWINAYIRK